MKFREMELGEALHIKHGYAFKGQFFSDAGTHIVLTPGNFNEEGGFRLRPGKDRYYSGNIPEDFILGEGDLIVAMTEQGPGLLGSSAIIPEDGHYLHNQRLGLANHLDESLLEKRFLYYLFNTRPVRGQIDGSASGTKVRHTAPERIYRVKVRIPDVLVQGKIASILSAYDDLIENNRRRIQLLEQAARQLYQEWFVRLRFPGHEHAKTKNGVPEGWEKRSFSDIATFMNGYAFKPTQLGESGLPVVKIPELRDGPTSKTPKNPGDTIPDKYAINTGDILFSWSGTLWVNIWNHGQALLNQHLFKVTPNDPNLRSLVYLALIAALDLFYNQTTGATMKHIRKGALESVTTLVPSTILLKQFEDATFHMLQQISVLQQQIERLQQARDLLLPRLMNGEMTV